MTDDRRPAIDPADAELDALLRDHHDRLEASATPEPQFAADLGRQLLTVSRARDSRRWLVPAAAALAVAAVLGGAITAGIVGLRGIGEEPSITPEPSLIASTAEPSASSVPTGSETATASPTGTSSPTPEPTVTPAATARPTQTPLPVARNGLIAYALDQDIWVANADGGAPQRLTNTPDRDKHELTWSFDGRLLAFNEVVTGADLVVDVMAPDGSGRRTVADVSAYRMTWAPESNRLAVSVFPSGILIIDVDSGEETRLLSPEETMSIEWSPSGRYLAWLSAKAVVGGLWVYDTQTDVSARVPIAVGYASAMTWHPDERHMIVGVWQDDGGPTLSTVDIESGAIEHHPSGLLVGDVSLSPDGRLIAYARNSEPGRTEIGVISVADGTFTPLVDADGPLTWAPDSSALIFSHDGNVTRVPVDGGEPEVVARGYHAVQQPVR